MNRAAWGGLPVAIALAGCLSLDREGPLRTFARNVGQGGAESVHANVRMGAGQIRISGGAGRLLEAEFRTRMGEPRVKYEEQGGKGELRVEPRAAMGIQGGEDRWDLRFDEKIPLDLELHLGAGESRLDLAALALRSVEVHMGAGELKLDASGDYGRDVEIDVHGGVGHCRIRLPKSMAVEVDARGGIGQITARGLVKRGGRYVNSAGDAGKKRMRVRVRGGVGQIDLIE